MDRKTAADFPPEVLKLFDGYVHGRVSRREFLDRAGKYAVGGMTAAGMLGALSPNFAWAQQVKKDDPRIRADYAFYPSSQGSGRMRGYLARPATDARVPAMLVIHENRGLNPYIEDVTRRLAVEGYLAFAPDALTPLGGYPGDEDKARTLFGQLDEEKTRNDFTAACGYLKSRPDCTGKFGAIGFCWGGEMVNTLATRVPELKAAIPFYGPQPPADQVAKIKAALQAHHASNDARVNAGIAAYEAALKQAGVKYEIHMYPNTQHGFHNDTTPRYDEAAAKLAWSRALAWTKQHVG